MMQADPDYDVRIAATNALARLGPTASKAIPNIDGILRQPEYEPPVTATRAELDFKMKDHDYRKALSAARARIRG
jgi:HEAT repeat protein